MSEKSGSSTGSLVCGIIGLILVCTGYGGFVSFVLGIVGLCLASSAKSHGDTSGTRTAGFVLSLLSLIVGPIVAISCIACVGGVAASM